MFDLEKNRDLVSIKHSPSNLARGRSRIGSKLDGQITNARGKIGCNAKRMAVRNQKVLTGQN